MMPHHYDLPPFQPGQRRSETRWPEKREPLVRKQYAAEEIMGHLRTVEIELGKGLVVRDARRNRGITEQFVDDLLKGELFYMLYEAQLLVERWRRIYNQVRPHSALGSQSPAPNTIASQLVCGRVAERVA